MEQRIDQTPEPGSQTARKKSWRVAASCFGLIALMVGLSYAAVPLYEMFCRVTGFGGTPQIAQQAPKNTIERRIEIRFDANVGPHLPWTLTPEVVSTDMAVGETKTIYYHAQNRAKDPTVGVASYNVTPEKAAVYFNKLQCFCFEDQLLKAGEKTEMAVAFFVDPAIDLDPALKDVKTITLSYTMFQSKHAPDEVTKRLSSANTKPNTNTN
jgi:cytochrome c oxidase assembly protein subunit 11